MTTHLGTGKAWGADGAAAATEAAAAAKKRCEGTEYKLAIVFAWAEYDLPQVARSVQAELGPEVPLIGCSSTGEFTHEGSAVGEVAVALIASDHMSVRIGVGEQIGKGHEAAVKRAAAAFVGDEEDTEREGYRGRTLLLFSDGLAGKAEEIIDELMRATDMRYQLFGGAAADNVQFKQTFVFHGNRVLSDAFVCAEVLSDRPFGISLSHGWKPVSKPLRVTSAEGAVLKQLNGRPAWDTYREAAIEAGLKIEEGQEVPFLMNHILGIESSDGDKLRVPLAKNADGSLLCAAEVPNGSVVRIMVGDDSDIVAGGKRAAERALAQVDGATAAGALVFECVATRLRLGDSFSDEVSETSKAMGGAPVAGAVSFGQLARIHGEFTGLMDATSLVCVVPR